VLTETPTIVPAQRSTSGIRNDSSGHTQDLQFLDVPSPTKAARDMRGVGESSSAGRAAAMMDTDAQLARRLQKILDEEAAEDVALHHNREDPRRYDKQSGAESHGSVKGKGKAKSDDHARGNERTSKLRPENRGHGDGEHKHADSTSQKKGKFKM